MRTILYCHRLNKFSMNALLGAIETQDWHRELDIRLPRDMKGLGAELAAIPPGRPSVLLVSLLSSQLREAARIIAATRTAGGPFITVAGGPHATGDPKGTLSLGFDLVARGEGEATITKLLAALLAGESPDSVPGVAAQGGTAMVPLPQAVDLDAWPPFSVEHRMFGPIEITRGCPFGCGYCQTPRLFGGRIRHRSADTIIGHVETLHSRGMRDIRFITPNALAYGSPDGRRLNLPAIHELLAGVRKVIGPDGRIFFGSFPSEVRPEHVTPETIEILRRYADSDNLVIGAQSGSPRMLEMCRRQHTVEDVFQAVALTAGAGLTPLVDFIFGLPGETGDDAEATLAVMDRLTAIGAKVHAHTFMPFPLTPFADAPAGRVEGRVRERLKELIGVGQVFGNWQEQERIAASLYDISQQKTSTRG